MSEHDNSGWKPSERMKRLAEKKGIVIPDMGVIEKKTNESVEINSNREPNQKIPIVEVNESEHENNGTAVEVDKNEAENILKRKKITKDLEVALTEIDILADEETKKRNKKLEWEAKDSLKNEGIQIDLYLRKNLLLGKEYDENKKEFGIRKGNLREIVNKMKSGSALTQTEQEIIDIINLKQENILKESEEVVDEDENRAYDSASTTEKKIPRKNLIDDKLENISKYSSSLSRKSLIKFKEDLMNKGASPDDVNKVDKALKDLAEREAIEIQEYKDKGEMRPELKVAVEQYYSELEKKYDSGGNMVNFYQKTPDFELSKMLVEMKTIGDDGEEISRDLEKELFDIGILHDLRIMVNNRDSVDKSMTEYAALLKGEQFDGLIHLKDRFIKGIDGNSDLVLQNLAAIDEEARNIYHNSKDGSVFIMEDPNLEKKIIGKVVGGDKGRLNYLIARDLYRVTGGEARYGIAGYPNQDKDKGMSWVFKKNDDENNGGFYRGALNRRRDFGGAVDQGLDGTYRLRYWPELLKHLDPGISSFWENIWSKAEKSNAPNDLKSKFTYKNEIRLKMDVEARILPRKYAVLSTEALRSLRLGVKEAGKVCIDNEIKFNVWMDDIGKISGTMSKERSFIGAPNFKNFQSVIGVDYFPVYMKNREVVDRSGKVVGVRPINREQYLLERLGDLVEFNLKSNSMNPTQIATELEEYRKAGFLFKSESEMEDFMKKYGIPVSPQEKERENLKTFGKKMVGEKQGQREALGVAGNVLGKFFGEIFK